MGLSDHLRTKFDSGGADTSVPLSEIRIEYSQGRIAGMDVSQIEIGGIGEAIRLANAGELPTDMAAAAKTCDVEHLGRAGRLEDYPPEQQEQILREGLPNAGGPAGM